jgi:nucleotide-binding universal stress UspA family protein
MRASNFGERQLAGRDFTRLKTILVATDLSVREHAAVQRARQLALAHGARLKLMYMPPHGKDVPTGATQRLANLACQLEESGELRVGLVPVRCNEVDDLLEQAAGVHLVVLPHRRALSTAAFIRGQPVLRVLRGAGCPALVTRRAGDAYYRRILVGVDFSPESQVLVTFASHLDSRASVQLFHAIDTADEAKLRAADVTLHAVQAYRERAIDDAWHSMHAFTDLFAVAARQRLGASHERA